MVDQDRPIDNPLTQDPTQTLTPEEERRKILEEYYRSSFSTTASKELSVREAVKEEEEERKEFNEILRDSGLPSVSYRGFRADVTDITGPGYQGLTSESVSDLAAARYDRARQLAMDIGAGGAKFEELGINERGGRVGAYGFIDSIRANVNDAQAIIGLALLSNSVNDETKRKLSSLRADLDSTYGADPYTSQAIEGLKGLDPRKDVTGRAKLKVQEARDIIANDPGAPIDGQYTHDWLWGTLTSDPVLEKMLREAGVTKENSLKFSESESGAFVKGMESVSRRLYEHQLILEQIELSQNTQVALLDSFTDMIAIDPDVAPELGVELIGAGVSTGFSLLFPPAAVGAGMQWTAMVAKWTNRANKIARKANTAKKRLKQLERLGKARDTIRNFSAIRATGLLLRVRPGSLSMFGNAADLVLDTTNLSRKTKFALWAGAQGLDGAYGGVVANTYSNMERKAILSTLYNEGEDIDLLDGSTQAAQMGFLTSLTFGLALKGVGTVGSYGLSKALGKQDVTFLGTAKQTFAGSEAKTKEQRLKHKKELWVRVYGDSPDSLNNFDKASKVGFMGWLRGEDVATKVFLAGARQRARANIAVSFLTDGQVKNVDELRSKFGFTNGMNNTIFEGDLDRALMQIVEETETNFEASIALDSFEGFGPQGLRAKLLENNEFMSSLRNKDGKFFSDEDIKLFKEKQYGLLAAEEEILGLDGELRAIIVSTPNEAERAAKVEELIKGRLAEARERLGQVDQEGADLEAKLDEDDAIIVDLQKQIMDFLLTGKDDPRFPKSNVAELLKTESGTRQLQTALANLQAVLGASLIDIYDLVDVKAKASLTPEQKAKLDAIVAGKLPSDPRRSIPTAESSFDDIKLYAEANGISFNPKVWQKLPKNKRGARRRLIEDLKDNKDPETRKAALKRLAKAIEEEQKDTKEILQTLGEFQDQLDEKLVELGNTEKRQTKRAKAKDITEEKRTYLEERITNLERIEEEHAAGRLNIDPEKQDDIPTNAGFRDQSGIIEEKREIELNKNYDRYALEVLVTKSILDAYEKADGTVSQALARQIFRRYLPKNHELLKKKKLDEGDMRQLLKEAQEAIDERTVNDMDIQNSIAGRRTLYDTADIEADFELGKSQARQANAVLLAMLDNVKMGDPSRFVAPRVRSDLEADLDTRNARSTASRLDYDLKEDIQALDEAILRLKNILMAKAEHASKGNAGTGTRAAILSLFKKGEIVKDKDGKSTYLDNGPLSDIDVDAVFGEALASEGNTREFDLFNLEMVLQIMERRRDLGIQYLKTRELAEEINEKYSARYAAANEAIAASKERVESLAKRAIGKEPLEPGETVESVKELLKQERENLDKLRTDRTNLYRDMEIEQSATKASADKTPQQLRLEQAQLLTELRKQEAQEAKNKAGTDFRGASTEEEYVNKIIESIVNLSKSRGDTLAKSSLRNTENAIAYIEAEVIPYLPISPELKAKGIKALAVFGNGELDFQTPNTMAAAIRSMLRDNVDGTKRYDMEIDEFNEDTNVFETVKFKSEEVKDFSAVQPGTDKQIAKILDQIIYEDKVRRINELDFDDPNGPSEADILKFIQDGNLTQNMSTAQDRASLTIHADQVPPPLRTDLDRVESIEDYINRTVEQMMDLPPSHYSFIHDDLKALPGQFGVRMEDVNTRAYFRYNIEESKGNPWAQADPSGGFPVAIPLADPDNNYSIAHAILDASAWLYPEMTPEIIRAFERGEDIANAAKGSKARGSRLISQADGTANGTKHGVAESIAFKRRVALFEALKSRDSKTVKEALDLVKELVEADGSTDIDFYQNLTYEIGAELKDKNSSMSLGVRRALYAMNKADPERQFWVRGSKAGRSFSKKPLMIVPYNAKGKAVRAAVKGFFEDPDNAMYKQAMLAEAKNQGVTYDQVVEELTTAMIGGRDRALMNLVEKATGIPDAKGRMKSILEPNGLRDSLLPKAITNDKLEWSSPEGTQVMLDEATRLAKLATKGKTPTAKEVDVIFRALQIEAYARAILRKKEFDQMGTIPGVGEKLEQAKSPETMDDAMDIARLRFMQELTVIDKLYEARKSGDKLKIENLESLISGSKFTFFDRTTQALNRTAFAISKDDPSVKHVLKMTGQDAGGMSPSRALENTEDAIYINNLMDWRSRFVSPHRKEMDHKGEKSRRVILDPVQFVEESDATFKTSQAEARDDLEFVELYANDPNAKGAMSHSDWYAKHVDQGKAFAGGIYDIKFRGKTTKRKQIANRIKSLAEDEVQLREEWTKINQQLAKKGEPVLSPDASVDDIIAAATKLEEIRTRRLALKNALIMISPEFDAPLQKTADGTLVQTPPMTREEAFREWRRQSDDIEASAQRIKDNEIDTADEEYRSRFGRPWSSNYDSEGNLRLDELENPELQHRLRERELNNHEENELMELTPETPKTMGGGLGFRAIHPTQHIDNVLGVPSLREAHQVKTMGYTQELSRGTEGEKAVVRRRLSAEGDTANIDSNLQENGVLFDIDERNRVEFTDSEFLADVDITMESLAKSETLGIQSSPEQTDIMVKDVLTKHARKYGLDDLLGEEETVTETISEPEMISVRRSVQKSDEKDTRSGLEKAKTFDLSRETYLEGRKYTKTVLVEMAEDLGIEIPPKVKRSKKAELVDFILEERAKSKGLETEFVDEEIPTGKTVERTVTRVVKKTEPRWDLIYGHQVWLNNIIKFNEEVKRFDSMLNRHAKNGVPADEIERRRVAGIAALEKKWQKVVDTRVEDFETTANNPYDSNQIDPYQNIRTYKVRDEEGNRLTLREALLSVSEDERRRSNVGLVDPKGSLQGNKLDTSSQFSAPAPTREQDIGYVRDEKTGALLLKTRDGRIITKDPTKEGKQGERLESPGVLNVKGFATPKEGFYTGYRAENGEYIDIKDLDSNESFVVSITHAKDATILRKVVQNHMSELYPDHEIRSDEGLIRLTLSPEQAERLSEAVRNDPLIPNADKNVRFTIHGLEIMSGSIIGHQTRRIASANQSRHILQISANKYVGDMLFSSSLANNNVKRVTARHARMDSHLNETRDFHTNLENENQLILGFLERNAEPGVISQSSFHQTRYIDLKKMWDDESFRERVIMSTLSQKEIAAKDLLGVDDLNLISPYQVTNSRLNQLNSQMFDPTGPDRLNLKEGKETKYLLSVKDAGEDVEYVALKELREALGVKSLDDLKVLSGLDDIKPIELGIIMAGRSDKVKGDVKKQYITATDFKRIKKAVEDKETKIREGEQVFGRNSIDSLQKLEGLSDAEVKDAKLLAGLVFSDPKILNMRLLHNPEYARAYGITPTPRVLAAAQEIVASQKILQHGIDIAMSDGVTRQGYAPIALQVIQEDPDLQTKILNGEELSNVDYQKLYESWLKYEPGRPGSPELRGARDVGNIKDGATNRQKDLKRLIDEGVQIARQIMLRKEQDPLKDGSFTGRPFYRGEYPDKADGTPGDAAYFMNKTNFRQHIKGKDGLPSEAHKAIDEKLENLVKSGTLTVKELKMLRAVLAQMDGDLLENLDFFEVDNIKKRAIEIAEEQGLDAPNFAGRSPAGFMNTSKTGIALHLLKGRLGRELTAVDVILHEIGHAAQVRLYDHGSPEWHMTNSMLKNPEAPELVKRLVLAMNNGVLDGKSKRQIEFYLENPDEFVAALFSYNMQARTFKDRATMEAAYNDADEVVPGSGSVIKNILQKMINFSYSKILHIRKAFLDLDPSYRNQIDAITDVLLGKGQMPLRDVGDSPAIMFNTGNSTRMAEIQALRREREAAIFFGRAKETDPNIVEIDKAIKALEEQIKDGLRPSDYSVPELMPLSAKSNFFEHRIHKTIGSDGKIDFQKLIDDDPKLAIAFLAKHVLPYMKRGEYTDLSGTTFSLEEIYDAATNSNYKFTSQKVARGGKHWWKGFFDQVALMGSNTEATVNSNVQLEAGDARFMIVQILSEMYDNNSLSSASTFNGNNLATFSQISDNLDSDLNVRMAFHRDKLRSALFRTEEKKTNDRLSSLLGRSRILNDVAPGSEERSLALDEAMQLAGKSIISGRAGENARTRIAEMKADSDPRVKEVGEILEEMAEELKLNSEYVQDLAYQSGMLKGTTIDMTGPVPLKLKLTRQEMLDDAGAAYNEWAKSLGKLLERKMLSSIDDPEGSRLLDVQALVASSILPIEDPRNASIVKQPSVIYDHLKRLSELENPLIDAKQLEVLEKAGYFKEGGRFHQAMLDGEATLSFEFMSLLTDEGLNRYRRRISSFEGVSFEIRDYFSALKSKIDAQGEAPAVTRLGNDFEGAADIRQYLYTKKTVAKNSVRFDPGDVDYFEINDIFEDETLGSMLDYNPVVLSSGMARGIAADAADSLNFNRALTGTIEVTDPRNSEQQIKVGVKNLNTRTILKALQGYTEQAPMEPETKEALRKSLEFFSRARENILGYRSSFDKADAMYDKVLAGINPATFIFHGINLPGALITETSSSLLPIMPKLFRHPVAAFALIGEALTRGMTPINRARALKQTSAVLQTLRAEPVSRSNINLEKDVREHEVGGQGRDFLERAGKGLVGLIGKPAQMMINANKELAAMGAHSSLIDAVTQGKVIKLIDELEAVKKQAETSGLPELKMDNLQSENDALRKAAQKRFKQATTKAGINYDLALELQKSGLLNRELYSLIEASIKDTKSELVGIIDYDRTFRKARELGRRSTELNRKARIGHDMTSSEISDLTRQARELREESHLHDRFRNAMNTFVNLRIASQNVEPRIFDRPLLNNTGFNAFQNIYMSWVRAFYEQKGFIGAGRRASQSIGKLFSLYLNYFIWDTVYTSFMEMARGKSTEEIIHEAQNDPLFFSFKKAARLPVFGGKYGTAALYYLAQEAQRSRPVNEMMFKHLGRKQPYYTDDLIPFDPFGSPAEGVFNKALKGAGKVVNTLAETAVGDDIAYSAGQQREGSIYDYFPILNSMFAKIYRDRTKVRTLKEEMHYRNRRKMTYLDREQVRRHNRAKVNDMRERALNKMRQRLEEFRKRNR